LSTDTLRSLYFALVHPYHEYANTAWGWETLYYYKNCSLLRKGQLV